MSKGKLSKAKEKAWKEFSIYIRTRDCLKTMGTTEKGKCVSCGKIVEFKKSQAGHFIPGRHNGNLFSEHFVNLQCWQCNAPAFLGGKNGNALAYRKAMIKMHGPSAEEEAETEAAKIVQFKVFELEALRDRFKQMTKELLEGR